MDNFKTNSAEKPALLNTAVSFDEECEKPKTKFHLFLEEESEGEEDKEEAKKLSRGKKSDAKDIFELAASPYFAPKNPLEIQEVKKGETSKVDSPYNQEVLEIFEQISLISTKLYESGDSETTLYLDQHFSSPIFQGAEIVISEYSTAPKVFNVQINACTEAIALLQGQSSTLIDFVHNKRLPFSFGRVTAGLKEQKAQRKKVEGINEKNQHSLADENV